MHKGSSTPDDNRSLEEDMTELGLEDLVVLSQGMKRSLTSTGKGRLGEMARANLEAQCNASFTSSVSLPSPKSAKPVFHDSRRCTSDNALRSSRWRRPNAQVSVANYNRKAVVIMGQRSNAAGVKELVAMLANKCAVAEALETPELLSEDHCPFPECAMLSHVSKDAFYRVIIGSVNGVGVLLKAMKTFPQHAKLQEACCIALGNLCDRNGSNLVAVKTDGGVHQIVATMRLHPTSIAVQSAACDAFRNMSSLVMADKVDLDGNVLTAVVELLGKASKMYITPRAKQNAEELLKGLQLRSLRPC